MDQRCVICKSATYDEHDALVSSLRKQFWQMVPIRLLIWGDWNTAETNREDNIRLLGCTRVQGDVMKTIIFHENTIAHSPSNRYIVQFLRKYVEKIESMEEYELDDEMIEFYISLSATTNMSPMDAGVCFKTYTLDKEQYMRIVLQEEQLTISHGTTGLLTWEAGLFLSDFFVEHPDIIRDKNVIELGSGCGLAGFTCAAMGAANVLCTDVNGNVLHILEDNRKLNPSIVDKIQVADLDWEDTNECARLSKDVDVVIGSDILYDPTIVPLLVGALKTIVVSSQQVAYITAAFRNPDTFALFLRLIDETEVLGKSVMDLSETQLTTFCRVNPMDSIRLILITRK